MTLWRLEWLRLVRTRRLVALVGVFAFFGMLGPFTARYMPEIIKHAGGKVKVIVPPPVPADGITQFLSNAEQIGLLVVVLVASAALAFDSQRESAIFLRTRVTRLSAIVVPKVVVNMAACVGAFVVGAGLAWYETAVLLGGLPVARLLAGVGLVALYLVFVIAVVALVASVVSSVVTTAMSALGVVAVIGIVESLGVLRRWLPSHLVGSMTGLLNGAAITDYLPAVVVTVVLAAVSLWGSGRLLARRDV